MPCVPTVRGSSAVKRGEAVTSAAVWLGLENLADREKLVKIATWLMPSVPKHGVSRSGKFMETESGVLLARGWLCTRREGERLLLGTVWEGVVPVI